MSLIAQGDQNIHVVDSKKLKHEKAIEGDKGGDKLIPDKRSSSRQTEGVSQTSVICGHQDFLSWIILTQLVDAVNIRYDTQLATRTLWM